MPIKQFKRQVNAAVNYTIKQVDPRNTYFVTDCEAGTPGAIALKRTKNGSHHKAGDIFYVTGGNVIAGQVFGAWLQAGYAAPSKNINIGLTSTDENGQRTTEFVRFPVVGENGRARYNTLRFIASLLKADLDQPVDFKISTIVHKAGDVRNEETGEKWTKDGDQTYYTIHQQHLQNENNPNGQVKITEGDIYSQAVYYVLNGQTQQLKKGEKLPENTIPTPDTVGLIAYLEKAVGEINAKVIKNRQAANVTNTNVANDHFSDDDLTFGDDVPNDDAFGADDEPRATAGRMR